MNSQEIADIFSEAARQSAAVIQDAAWRMNFRGRVIIAPSDFDIQVVTLGIIAPHAMDYDSGMEAQWQEAHGAFRMTTFGS